MSQKLLVPWLVLNRVSIKVPSSISAAPNSIIGPFTGAVALHMITEQDTTIISACRHEFVKGTEETQLTTFCSFETRSSCKSNRYSNPVFFDVVFGHSSSLPAPHASSPSPPQHNNKAAAGGGHRCDRKDGAHLRNVGICHVYTYIPCTHRKL